ncbi:hypothetical protein [Clostridium thermobutyricum]|uniref:hypothetical protein n=1 Tax=Clostridium thermobutyricum TaxID=29372 RepID=UPI0029420E9C|nr:hypothetical protein [Clostridium thermobutyricum]
MNTNEFNFKEELKEFIQKRRNVLDMNDLCFNHLWSFGPEIKEKVRKERFILDKLEQDYFHLPADMSFENIKKFDEDGNIINEGEKEENTTEQVEEGLLKLFNKYVETVENNIETYIIDDNNYITSLCPIVDRLLKIESDKKLSQEYFKN